MVDDSRARVRFEECDVSDPEDLEASGVRRRPKLEVGLWPVRPTHRNLALANAILWVLLGSDT